MLLTLIVAFLVALLAAYETAVAGELLGAVRLISVGARTSVAPRKADRGHAGVEGGTTPRQLLDFLRRQVLL